MQSIKSKLVISLIRNRHLFKLKLRRPVCDENFSIENFRNSVEKASERANKNISKESYKQITINNMRAEWIVPNNPDKDKVVMYIHGGGFISGSCNTHRSHVLKFATKTNQKHILFDYRLAPEHCFLDSIDDTIEVYKYLLKKYDSKNISFMGESAGATLVLSTLLKIKDLQLPYPKKAVVISPLVDLNCKTKSFTRNIKKDIALINSWNVWGKLYNGGKSSYDHYLFSPVHGDFEGFPPIYICVGTYEVHYDDAKMLFNKLLRQKVETTYKEYPKMVHTFPIMAPFFKEATLAHNDICSFLSHSTN